MEFECINEKEKWTGKLEKIIRSDEETEIFVSGRSTMIHLIIGESLLGRWICFLE